MRLPGSGNSALHKRGGQAGFLFGGLVWLLGTLIVSFSSIPAAIVWFFGGAVYLGGEVWIERRGERHRGVTVWWWAAWRVFFGIGLIALGVIYLRWESIALFLFGAWSLALGAAVLSRIWREHHGESGQSRSS